MKTKYLFSALLGGALLASCSMDDELDTKLASQGSNLSAPVFTLHFDESDETRATMDSSAKLTFEAEDLFSLYHGLPVALSSLDTYENAIYEGTGDGENFDIATKSMVKKGMAIMVFPADLENLGSEATGGENKELKITIKKAQTFDTRDNTPFMSEFIKIDAPAATDGTSAEAGYGKHYDIYLKPVAATLLLDLNGLKFADNLTTGANELKINKVELVSTKENGLTTEVKIKDGATAPHSNDKYKSWSSVSEIEAVETENKSITTTDIRNGIATFTLFPASSSYDGEYDIKIHTNYGVASISTEVETTEGFLVNGETKQSVNEGLMEILKPSVTGETGCWSKSKTKTSKFYGEKVGKAYRRSLTGTVTQLKMNGMHIENEDVLVDIVNVIKAMNSSEVITLKLDGENGGEKFVMTAGAGKGLEAYETAINLTNAVKFVYCTEPGETCKKVVLKNTADAAAVIPTDLAFEGSGNVVELAGKWAFSSNQNDEYSYTNVSFLTVAADGILILNGNVEAIEGLSSPIVNNGNINVTANTVLKQSITNNGYFTIDANVRINMAGDGILTNNVTPAAGSNAADVNKASRGKIDNSGVLGISEDTNAKIHNYGVIYAKNGSYTLLSTNASSTTSLTSAFSATNVYGIIELSGTPLAVEILSEEKGFIKRIKEKDSDSVDGANYVVLNGDCTELSKGGLKYVEINASAVTLKYANGDNRPKTDWSALIVSGNSVVTIPANNTVDMNSESSVTVVKGTIVRGGAFNYNEDGFSSTTYFGNTAKDAENIIGTGK